jgi:acetyl-CoA C-acetyltransferase
MRPVYIGGIGQTVVAEHWQRSWVSLAQQAAEQALAQHAVTPTVGAVYVANALGAALGIQSDMAPVVAATLGLTGVETLSIDAGGAAGGLAIRQAMLAVAAGAHEAVLVVGVEKVSDVLDERRESALALTTDTDWEAAHGVTLTAQWAMLMRRYMHEYAVEAADFASFPVNSHANAVPNKAALYRFAISADKLKSAGMIAAPLGLLDCSTVADGAAAVIITAHPDAQVGRQVRIVASTVASDVVALHDRPDLLDLQGVRTGFTRALAQAQLNRDDIDVADISDPHGIAAVLGLEAMGFAARGTGVLLGQTGAITPSGSIPLALSGGCKARGDVLGALGVYQVVEMTAQLRGTAPTQVPGARVALAQCMSGIGNSVVTHILQGEE